MHDDGSVHVDGAAQDEAKESAWRRPKYVEEQDQADRLDEEFAPRPSAAERPYNNNWRLANYIRACALNPDPNKPIASFYAWNPGEPWAGIVRGPFFCKSWRCQWGCAEHEAHVMFARMLEAFEPYQGHELVFVVLTLDAEFHRLDFQKLDEVYRELRQRIEWWRKRLQRQLEKQGLGDFGNRWVGVIEQHETGVPHVNLVMHAPAWARWLETRRLERQRNGQTKRTARLIANTEHRRNEMDLVWLRMLNECGFGFASTAEQVRSKEEVLGYCASVARHADESAGHIKRIFVDGEKAVKPRRRRRRRRSNDPLRMLGELAKKRQLPTRAPKGFRRLRSGRHFLPPRQKGDKTGCILSHSRTDTGYEHVRALTKTKDLDRARATAMCEELERIRVWDERNARENGELAAAIAKQTLEVRDLAIMASNGSGGEAGAKEFVAALKKLGEMKRTRRRRGVEKVQVSDELLERFQCGPPRAPPPPVPPDDPPARPWKPQPLPGVA